MIHLHLDRFDFVSAVEGFARGSHLRQHVWKQIVYPSIPQMSLDEMDFLWYFFRRDFWPHYFFDLMEQSYTIVVDCGRLTSVGKKAPHFKTYDKVLVRNRKQSWKIDLFSHYEQFGFYNFRTLGGYYEYCIPYDGNEHLVGKEVIDGEK